MDTLTTQPEAASAPPAKICAACGATFTLPPDAATIPILARLWTQYVTTCETCCGKIIAEQTARLVSNSAALQSDKWQRLCPPEFQQHDTNRYPAASRLNLNIVLRWEYNPRGLLLYGPTRTGKSRAAWLVARKHWKAGRSLALLDSNAGIVYAATYGTDAAAAAHWIERQCRVDLLLLDDVFKARLTDSFEQALYTIIRNRTENHKPVIVTTNDIGKTLLERMTPDRGPAIIERLREYCQGINFV